MKMCIYVSNNSAALARHADVSFSCCSVQSTYVHVGKHDSVNQRALQTYPEITVNYETRGSASPGLKVIKTTKTDPQLP